MAATLDVPFDRLYIGGEWRPPRAGGTFADLDPSTREPIAEVARGAGADVDDAVSAARAAADGWAKRSPAERGEILRRWGRLIRDHAEELAVIEARDVGKPISAARVNVAVGVGNLEYAAGYADKVMGATLPSRSPDHTGLTWREPWGVCAAVLAWNVPAIMYCSAAGPALAVGNTLVMKPSEMAPLVTLALTALAAEAGMPPGVLNVVSGLGPEAGVALTSHPGVDHVSFVGSAATGRAVMKAAAENLVPVRLELGGKSPNVVFADADLDLAVPAIVGSITENAGQNCYAGSRLLVEQSVYDTVVEQVADRMAGLRLGRWSDDLDMGPLINAAQYDRVLGHVAGAVADGARVVTGGGPATEGDLAAGWFARPTMLDKVDASMAIAREEVFGPVLAAQPFGSMAEALELVDAAPYGLLVSVWTDDLSRALTVAREVRSGQVSINEFANSYILGLPFNVAKQSGFNHGGGYNAVLETTREKAVTIRLSPR
ncbi:MAG: aldehyde dehydrogenase family protein [Acidimicrobiales bacterium]